MLFLFSKLSTLDQQTDDGLKRSSTSDCAPNGTIHGGFTLGDFTESTLVFQSVVWMCCNERKPGAKLQAASLF